MLSALMILCAMLILVVFGNLNKMLQWLRIKKWIIVQFLVFIILFYFVPTVRIFNIVEFNIGGFIAVFMLGFALIYVQKSWNETVRVIISCLLSLMLILLVDSPFLMFSNIIFQFNIYIKLLLICLPSILLSRRPGGALSACIISPVIYDIYSGFLQIGRNEIPSLGGEIILELIVYSLLGGVFLSLIMFPLKNRRKKNVLQFSTK